MSRQSTIALPLSLCFALAMAAIQAQAAFAHLVRQYERGSPTGPTVLVCVYAVDGKELEREYPVGNFCPGRVEV